MTQCKALLSQPLDKRCSKANSFDIKLKLEKIWKAIFSSYSLILGAKRLFHNLFVKIRCMLQNVNGSA
ncbi:hypothetical protein E1H99_05530 [Enterococcus hirae]|nr:hypothetical protein E1H99_05530 [Enterococcus hirae]